MPTKVLVVGGAGFIGSHMTLRLREMGYETVVFDNLHTGFEEAVFGPFVKGDLRNREQLFQLFHEHQFDAVLHFAALTAVGESVLQPDLYYENNVVGTLNLLDCMLEVGTTKLIFSSTAAVYGEPKRLPIEEGAPKEPCNPYGRTKWMVEQILSDYEKLGLRSIVFRYFNAAGGDPHMRTGERRNPVSHLIPIVLEVAQKKRKQIELFGDDYETPDGSCIRDYVHVSDLCEAHLLGLERLLSAKGSSVYNLGSGTGHTVLEVVRLARTITQREIPLVIGPRRPGDGAKLVASSQKAQSELGWKPLYSDLSRMISDTWRWMERFEAHTTLLKEGGKKIETGV